MKGKIKNVVDNFKGIIGIGLSLGKANFKLRNEGSYLGVFWYLLNPLALLVIILFVKGAAFSDAKISYYPIYLLMGVIMNNFFSRTLSSAIKVMDENSGLIKSIKIKYESLVVAKVIESVFSHFFEIAILAIFLFFAKISLIGIIYYFLVLVFFSIFLCGASFLFAVIGVYLNDFGNIWGIATQLIFFVTPIFYVLNKNTNLYAINLFNPLYYFLSAARELVIYDKIPGVTITLGVIIFSFLSLISGLAVFKKFNSKFAELV